MEPQKTEEKQEEIRTEAAAPRREPEDSPEHANQQARIEALQAQIAQLQEDRAAAAQAHAAEIRQLRLDHAVERALTQAGAINPATVRPLLQPLLETAELTEDGSVKGLPEEVERLANGADTAFLFRPRPAAPAVSGATPAGSVTRTPDPRAAAWETRLAAARQAGSTAAAVQIKRQAVAEGILLY